MRKMAKPGPKPLKPTAAQRRRIVRGIAVGLTLKQLAADIDMPLGTMRRVFDAEIRSGRVRAILDNLDRLHSAADRGNVAAMRELSKLMMQEGKPDDAEDDWADVVGGPSANLSRNLDFH